MRTAIIFSLTILWSTISLAQTHFKMEGGRISLPSTSSSDTPSNFVQVNLQYTYDNPVVIAKGIKSNGGDVSSVQVRNITSNSFEIATIETYLKNPDGTHTNEEVHYIVAEMGVWDLPNGQIIEAGIHVTNTSMYYDNSLYGSYDTITLTGSFSSPIVFAQREAYLNEIRAVPGTGSEHFLMASVHNVSSSNFNLTLDASSCQTSSFSSWPVQDETISWIAIEDSITDAFTDEDNNVISFETQRTPEFINGLGNSGEDDGDSDITFSHGYSSAPMVVFTKQTRNLPQGGWLRYKNLDTTRIQLDVDYCYTSSKDERDMEGGIYAESAGLFTFSEAFRVQDMDPDGDGVDVNTDNCNYIANPLQENYDGDAYGDICDLDDDNDGVPDTTDPDDNDNTICGDSDLDSCDDCLTGSFDIVNDDSDNDGLCYDVDPDDDNDTVADGSDPAPFDSSICGLDNDSDSCDDCSQMPLGPDQNNDGLDSDSDGLCDAGDPDDDNDNVDDTNDVATLDPYRCKDDDNDLCDDCSIEGMYSPSNDGLDSDNDGLCNIGDSDDDNDGVSDSIDSEPLNAYLCGVDSDNDLCDDCVSGTVNFQDDGSDNDGDWICDYSDPDDDNDSVSDTEDNDPFNNFVCLDSDNDLCDDCSVTGSFTPAHDGADLDNDSLCNVGDVDIDGDGITNDIERYYEVDGQTDYDGIPAAYDLDSDGDGIIDAIELTLNPDGDAYPNFVDIDSDGDLIPDSIELILDTDADGIFNCYDVDADGDGTLDIDEAGQDLDASGFIGDAVNELADSDSDGIENYIDPHDDIQGSGILDSDTDGIPDHIENNANADPDATGPDSDADNDGATNSHDWDSDGDLVPDYIEGVSDFDFDGIPNFLDLDSDDDGLSDSHEAGIDTNGSGWIGDMPGELADGDNDGLPDIYDPLIPISDSDGDYIADHDECSIDADSDGLACWQDLDSDNDGLPDQFEAGDANPKTPPRDTDGDGIADFWDIDSDNDLIPDNVEGNTDSDLDGTINAYDIDSDNDSIEDRIETADDFDLDHIPNYLDLDSDNDGLSDSFEGSSDIDLDGSPNFIDLDSDGDSLLDEDEGSEDLDHDSIINAYDSDDDGDGIDTNIEIADIDFYHIATDLDSDGQPNYYDTDADGDGIPDAEEGRNDDDHDGLPNYLDTVDNDNADASSEQSYTPYIRGVGCGGCNQSSQGIWWFLIMGWFFLRKPKQ